MRQRSHVRTTSLSLPDLLRALRSPLIALAAVALVANLLAPILVGPHHMGSSASICWAAGDGDSGSGGGVPSSPCCAAGIMALCVGPANNGVTLRQVLSVPQAPAVETVRAAQPRSAPPIRGPPHPELV